MLKATRENSWVQIAENMRSEMSYLEADQAWFSQLELCVYLTSFQDTHVYSLLCYSRPKSPKVF